MPYGVKIKFKPSILPVWLQTIWMTTSGHCSQPLFPCQNIGSTGSREVNAPHPEGSRRANKLCWPTIHRSLPGALAAPSEFRLNPNTYFLNRYRIADSSKHPLIGLVTPMVKTDDRIDEPGEQRPVIHDHSSGVSRLLPDGCPHNPLHHARNWFVTKPNTIGIDCESGNKCQWIKPRHRFRQVAKASAACQFGPLPEL
jgi:hypothetical protein